MAKQFAASLNSIPNCTELRIKILNQTQACALSSILQQILIILQVMENRINIDYIIYNMKNNLVAVPRKVFLTKTLLAKLLLIAKDTSISIISKLIKRFIKISFYGAHRKEILMMTHNIV